MQRGLTIKQHRVPVSKVSVNKLIFRLRALRVRARDEQRLGHGFALNRIEGGNVDALPIFVFNAHGT